MERVGETGFDSSPKTRGVLVRAHKPSETAWMKKEPVTIGSALPEVESDKDSLSRSATLEELVARALSLGAESAKIIDTETVVVEKDDGSLRYRRIQNGPPKWVWDRHVQGDLRGVDFLCNGPG